VAEETIEDLLTDLTDEQESLMAVLRCIGDDDWFTPTPAKYWDVRDTIAHFADTDELAFDTLTNGERTLNDFAARLASGEDVTFWGVQRGRRLAGKQVLTWWERTAAAQRNQFALTPPDFRVPWGLGMRTASLIKARLMEAFAHGHDVRVALGVDVPDSPRMRHVAWLATRALPYAYTVAGREPPAGALRVELDLSDGGTWTYGPDDAPNRITGPALQYCEVFVQRRRWADAPDLVADGDAAVAALEVARAYL